MRSWLADYCSIGSEGILIAWCNHTQTESEVQNANEIRLQRVEKSHRKRLLILLLFHCLCCSAALLHGRFRPFINCFLKLESCVVCCVVRNRKSQNLISSTSAKSNEKRCSTFTASDDANDSIELVIIFRVQVLLCLVAVVACRSRSVGSKSMSSAQGRC